MNKKKAIGAGILGAFVMTLIMIVARAMNLTSMNLEMTLGSMLTQNLTLGTWFLGLAIHLFAGAVFALIYAGFFERTTARATWGLGTLYGAIHAIFSGFLMLAMPLIHPLMVSAPAVPAAGQFAAPGPFVINYGLFTATAFVLLHVIYGAIVGGIYTKKSRRAIKISERIEEERFQKVA